MKTLLLIMILSLTIGCERDEATVLTTDNNGPTFVDNDSNNGSNPPINIDIDVNNDANNSNSVDNGNDIDNSSNSESNNSNSNTSQNQNIADSESNSASSSIATNQNLIKILNKLNNCSKNVLSNACQGAANNFISMVTPFCVENNDPVYSYSCNFPCDDGQLLETHWICQSNPLKGPKGEDGAKGQSCTTIDDPAGARIVCEDGTSTLIKDGKDGEDGSCDKNCCNKVRYCEASKATKHSVWFSSRTGIGSKYLFNSGGSWVEHNNHAKLTGLLVNYYDNEKMFLMDITMRKRINSVNNGGMTPSGSPKEAPNGVDTDSWTYWKEMEGTLIGQGKYTGAVIKIYRRGPAPQVGMGAGVHDTNYGAASWFKYEVLSQPITGHTIYDNLSKNHGDININLECETDENTCSNNHHSCHHN